MANEEYTTMKSNVSEQKHDDTSGQNRSSLSQQANQAKETVKNTVSDTAGSVKEQVRQTAHEARQAVSELAADAKTTAKETANQALNEARTRAESVVDERKSQTAERLQGIAGALRETGNTLHERQEDAFADYANAAADQIEKFSGYLREQNVGSLLRDIEGFARRQPELFLAGTLAAGFMLGRFFKSSGASPSQGQWNQRYSQSGYNAQPYNQYGAPGYGGSYDTGSYSGQYGASAYQRQYGSSDYSGQMGSAEYQRQYGSSSAQSQSQYGASTYNRQTSGQGQYGASGYQGQQGLSEQQYARQGQTNWANAAGTPGQMSSATGEMANTTSQSGKQDPNRSVQNNAGQNESRGAQSGPSQSNQQKADQSKGSSSSSQSSTSTLRELRPQGGVTMQYHEEIAAGMRHAEPAVYTASEPTEPSIGTLFTDLTEDMGKLVRQEIELARVETIQKVNRAMRSVILLAAGGLVAYAGFITLLITVAIALGRVMPYWLSTLIVGVVALIVGAILIGSGRSSLSNLTVVPENTVESIKEDARWAKEQVS